MACFIKTRKALCCDWLVSAEQFATNIFIGWVVIDNIQTGSGMDCKMLQYEYCVTKQEGNCLCTELKINAMLVSGKWTKDKHIYLSWNGTLRQEPEKAAYILNNLLLLEVDKLSSRNLVNHTNWMTSFISTDRKSFCSYYMSCYFEFLWSGFIIWLRFSK